MKNNKQKELTYEQLISTADYLNRRSAILKEINTLFIKVDVNSFKKSDEEKSKLLTAKRNWKGNEKEFWQEFMKSNSPNWGAMKFQGIQL